MFLLEFIAGSIAIALVFFIARYSRPLPPEYAEKYKRDSRLAEDVEQSIIFPWQERLQTQLQAGWKDTHPKIKAYLSKLKEYTDLEDTLPSDLKLKLQRELYDLGEKLSIEFRRPWETRTLNVSDSVVKKELSRDLIRLRVFLRDWVRTWIDMKIKLIGQFFADLKKKPETVSSGSGQQHQRQHSHKKQGYDPYLVLGLTPDANTGEIKKAYHRLVRIYHPDQWVGTELYSQALERTAMINRAREDLVDQRRKQEPRRKKPA